MGGDAKVGQNAVHRIGLVVFQKTTEILEIRGDKREPIIVNQMRLHIGILVKGDEAAVFKFVENGARMAAATIGDIHINPIRIGNQIIYRKLTEDGVMIFHWPPPFPAYNDRGASPR